MKNEFPHVKRFVRYENFATMILKFFRIHYSARRSEIAIAVDVCGDS